MNRSTDRILTTHAGRLQRPDAITAAMEEHPEGRPTHSKFSTLLEQAVSNVVQKQIDIGIDVVNDGEFGKLSWNSYLNGRLAGHEIISIADFMPPDRLSRDRQEFAEFYREMESKEAQYHRNPGRYTPPGTRWACTGPVRYKGHGELQQDLQNLRAAVDKAGGTEAFIPATSPVRPRMNKYYPTETDYYVAVGEAMREEYLAITAAGFLLQIDDPHLPDLWETHIPALSVAEYRKHAEKYVELVNHAIRGIPEDRIRYHVCWGSWHGPHTHDLPLRDIVDILLKVNVQGYVLEAANPRHEHEWQVWRGVKLPYGKILIPGVVSHATNVVEHPELIAWRLKNFADVVGKENIIAGTDCGLGYRVHTQIAEAKLRAMVEGVAIASRELWNT